MGAADQNRDMSATSSDYRWIADSNLWPLGAYCLTFVRALPPCEVLDRLHVQDRVRIQGAGAIIEPASDAWVAHEGRQLFVAVTQADGWSVMFEENGFIGVTRSLMAAVSKGTSTVGHFRNVNAFDQFLWLEDGEVALYFEPLFPSRREGTRADEVVPEMRSAGFDLREGEERTFEGHTAAAFALAERITGVRVTPELLDAATFVGGLVRVPLP